MIEIENIFLKMKFWLLVKRSLLKDYLEQLSIFKAYPMIEYTMFHFSNIYDLQCTDCLATWKRFNLFPPWIQIVNL